MASAEATAHSQSALRLPGALACSRLVEWLSASVAKWTSPLTGDVAFPPLYLLPRLCGDGSARGLACARVCARVRSRARSRAPACALACARVHSCALVLPCGDVKRSLRFRDCTRFQCQERRIQKRASRAASPLSASRMSTRDTDIRGDAGGLSSHPLSPAARCALMSWRLATRPRRTCRRAHGAGEPMRREAHAPPQAVSDARSS